MTLYAMIMLATASMFGVIAALIYKGKTELIHDYHQSKVKDKPAYGKAFGKALSVMAGAMALSGAVALFGERAMGWATAVVLIGLAVGLVAIVRVQKKYNGGVF